MTDEDIRKEGKSEDDDLLDFEFDDLSEEDLMEAMDEEGSSDEEIIELVDVVEEGDRAAGPAVGGGAEEAHEEIDLGSSEFAKTVEAPSSDSLEEDIASMLDSLEPEEAQAAGEEGGGESAEFDEISQLLEDAGPADEEEKTELEFDRSCTLFWAIRPSGESSREK